MQFSRIQVADLDHYTILLVDSLLRLGVRRGALHWVPYKGEAKVAVVMSRAGRGVKGGKRDAWWGRGATLLAIVGDVILMAMHDPATCLMARQVVYVARSLAPTWSTTRTSAVDGSKSRRATGEANVRTRGDTIEKNANRCANAWLCFVSKIIPMLSRSTALTFRPTPRQPQAIFRDVTYCLSASKSILIFSCQAFSS